MNGSPPSENFGPAAPSSAAEDRPVSTDPNPDEEKRMLLWEHLDELRSGLIRSLLAIGLVLIVTYYYCEPIVRFLEQPLLDILPPGESLYYTGIGDKFFIYLKVSIIASVFIVSPYLLFEIWKFIAPALYREERRFAFAFVIMGSIAFVVGAAFAYYVVIPFGYKFLLNFGSGEEKAIITLTEYFGLTLKMLLALGIVFELPVLLILLARFGIVDEALLVKNRRLAFVAASVVSAIATPSPDAFTMLIVLFPLYFLYEISIIGVRWVARSQAKGN